MAPWRAGCHLLLGALLDYYTFTAEARRRRGYAEKNSRMTNLRWATGTRVTGNGRLTKQEHPVISLNSSARSSLRLRA